MKKWMTIALSLMMVFAAVGTLAESETIEVTFDSDVWAFEEYGFTIELPKGWVETESEEYSFLLVNPEDEAQMIALKISLTEGDTLEESVDILSAEEGIENVELITLNGVGFVQYEVPASATMGAYAVTADGEEFLNFMFTPISDEMIEIAQQVLISIES